MALQAQIYLLIMRNIKVISEGYIFNYTSCSLFAFHYFPLVKLSLLRVNESVRLFGYIIDKRTQAKNKYRV